MVFPTLSRYGTQLAAGVLFLFYIQDCAAQGPQMAPGANNGPSNAAPTSSTAAPLTTSTASSTHTSSSAPVSSTTASTTSHNKSFINVVGIGGLVGIIIGSVIVVVLVLLLLAACRQRWRRARRKPHGVTLSALPNNFTKSSQGSPTEGSQTRPLISGPLLLSPPSFMPPRFPSQRKAQGQYDTNSLSSSIASSAKVSGATNYDGLHYEYQRGPTQRQNSTADSASIYSSEALQSPYESTIPVVNENKGNNARVSVFYTDDNWSTIPPSQQSSSLRLMTAHQKALEAEQEDGSSLLVAPPGYSPV